MMVAYAKPEDIEDSLTLNVNINYVVDIYGPTDLESLYHSQTVKKINEGLEKLPESLKAHLDINQYLFGFDPEKDSARAKAVIEKYSPINYLNSKIPPTLIIQGEADQIVPVNQSAGLHSKLDSLGVKNKYYQLPEVKHAFRSINKQQKADVQDWIVDFIEENYKP
jgi:acetyl esterase/lipase